MRVIAGKFRGRKLKSPSSLQTRPTSDRLRETLFNIIAPRIEGARFLDLCAGSGAVGIEALSRGAQHVTFVDQSRDSSNLIRTNVSLLEVEQQDFEIVTADALEFLQRLVKKPSQPFDIVFFDPPYAADSEAALNFVSENVTLILGRGGIMIVEHYKKRELRECFEVLKRYRQLQQGDSALSFFEVEA